MPEFALICFTLYAMAILGVRRAWQNLSEYKRSYENQKTVSVIVPARNEHSNLSNILNDLLNQDYKKLEIIVVDDHSTPPLETGFRHLVSEKVHFIDAGSELGKKAALNKGISMANGEIIMTTDADCRVSANWVSQMVAALEATHADLCCGTVGYLKSKSILAEFQRLDLLALTGFSGAFLQIGRPLMCNGANLAFRKAVFFEVGGYAGNEQIASGDDLFLLRKIARKGMGSVVFNKNSRVWTSFEANWRTLMHQKIRWSSKWKNKNAGHIRWLAPMVGFFSFLWIVIFTGTLLNYWHFGFFLSVMLLKIVPDYLLLLSVSKVYGERLNLIYFTASSFLYPFYAIFTGILTFKNSYTWKNRKVSI